MAELEIRLVRYPNADPLLTLGRTGEATPIALTMHEADALITALYAGQRQVFIQPHAAEVETTAIPIAKFNPLGVGVR